jgi:cytochrome c-type biogenesis protein CcmH
MRLKLKLSIILFILLLLSLSSAEVNAATVSDISKQLICQCGCNMVLLNCTHAECSWREAMISSIRERIAQGQSEREIIQFLVTQYGEKVLAAPPKRGFNLMAWITPFVALLFGGGIIGIMLRKWLKKGRELMVTPQVEEEEKDKKYQHQLEKELAEFTERSFR